MKKLTAFLLATTTCLSMGATLAACNGDDSSSSSSGKEVKTTVTETEWTASFNLGTNWTVSYAQVSPEMGTSSGEYKRDGSKFSEAATYTEGTATRTSTSYTEIVGDKVYRYIPSYADGVLQGYNKSEWDGTPDEYVADMVAELMPEELRVYSEYTYNETTKVYELASKTLYEGTDYEATVTDVKASLADGKITKVEYKVAAEEYSISSTLNFTYGGASITLPTIEEPEEPEVPEMTAAQWAQIMNISTTNFQLTQNMYMGGTETPTQTTVSTKYGDDMKVVASLPGGATTEYYVEKDGNNYYRYDLSNNAWTKAPREQADYDSQVNSFNFNLMFGFDDFTYNSETGTYDCAFVENTGLDNATDLKNISVTITDGALRKVVWTMEIPMGDTPVEVTFEGVLNYGSVTFELPEVSE